MEDFFIYSLWKSLLRAKNKFHQTLRMSLETRIITEMVDMYFRDFMYTKTGVIQEIVYYQ